MRFFRVFIVERHDKMSDALATALTGLTALRDRLRTQTVEKMLGIIAARLQKIVDSGEVEAMIRKNEKAYLLTTLSEISKLLPETKLEYLGEVLEYIRTTQKLGPEFEVSAGGEISVRW